MSITTKNILDILSQTNDIIVMEQVKKRIKIYKDINGHEPFADWVKTLSALVRARIFTKLDRVETGNLGDHKYIGDGISEFRLDFDSGYRIYYGKIKNDIITLLCGGDKSTQRKNIKKAKEYWNAHKKRGTL